MRRNSSIELYRILAMLGICLLHCNTQTAFGCEWEARLLLPCVNAFVFISGWYGLSFSFRKLFRLWGVAAYAGCCVMALGWLFCPERLTLPMLKYVFADQWFLVAYAVLMLAAPWLNHVIDHLDRKNFLAFCIPLGLLLLWNWGTEIPWLRHYLPRPVGFGSYTPLALGLTYVFARICRRLEIQSVIPTRFVIVFGIFSAAAIVFCPSLNAGCYASPVAMVLAGCAFVLIGKTASCRFVGGGGIGRAAVLLAPSMFTAYLLHAHEIGFDIMRQILQMMCCAGVPDEPAKICVAMVVLACGVLVDCPRRIVCKMIRVWVQRQGAIRV